MSKLFCFSVVYELGQYICIYFCSWNKTNPMRLPEFDACPMHSALRASGIGRIKIQCACIGFVLFHSKK